MSIVEFNWAVYLLVRPWQPPLMKSNSDSDSDLLIPVPANLNPWLCGNCGGLQPPG